MTTPEEKLCSRRWRMLHSSYLLWGVLSFGLFTFIGFWVIAGKSHRRAWIISASLWTVFNVVTLILLGSGEGGTKENPDTSTIAAVSGTLLFVGWVGGILHSVLVRKGWLRWKAYQQPGAWYVQPGMVSAVPAAADRRLDPAQAEGLLRGGYVPPAQTAVTAPAPTGAWNPPVPTVTQQARPAAAPQIEHGRVALPTEIDINSADVAAFMGTGLDRPWAEWLVATRGRLGRYASVDQLLTDGQMPPHLFASVRGRLIVGQAGSDESGLTARPGAGRRLDL
ncbi:hypothetical protein [Frigoribacterium faeni]|uniref:hypothetical protein n=1 Tax=Frigoribacterium faeni TaxID=145483 RepID=UPI0024138ACE|nr:hypothetical protein [Frigoribacterium faeni]